MFGFHSHLSLFSFDLELVVSRVSYHCDMVVVYALFHSHHVVGW